MDFVAVIIVVAVVFGLCFAVDKIFGKIFRGKEQHKSGKSVRLSKRYGSIGVLLFALGVAGCFSGFGIYLCVCIYPGWIYVGIAACGISTIPYRKV